MNGYVYLLNTREIVIKNENVQSVTDSSIVGSDCTCRGIDLSVANFIVTDAEFEVGNILPENEVDKRSLLPKTEVELLQNQVALLQSQVASLTTP